MLRTCRGTVCARTLPVDPPITETARSNQADVRPKPRRARRALGKVANPLSGSEMSCDTTDKQHARLYAHSLENRGEPAFISIERPWKTEIRRTPMSEHNWSLSLTCRNFGQLQVNVTKHMRNPPSLQCHFRGIYALHVRCFIRANN